MHKPTAVLMIITGLLFTACSATPDRVALSNYTPEPGANLPSAPTDLTVGERSVWEAGLLAWRTPREAINAACVNCHAPDAFDLAMLDFKDKDIRRRAQGDGLSPEQVDAIVSFVHLQRRRYNITNPPDPLTFRPFQPGGSVLPGETAVERDKAFFAELERIAPRYAQADIRSVEDAQAVVNEISAINIQEQRIGIPLPLWASDTFHGQEFATTDEWVTNIPCLPTSDAYYQLQNNYIMNPTEDTFWEMWNAVDTDTDCNREARKRGLVGPKIESHKHRSMLIGQHAFRAEALGDTFVEGPLAFRGYGEKFQEKFSPNLLPQNDIWQISELTRKPGKPSSKPASRSLGDKLVTWGYPKFITDNLQGRSDAYFQKDQQRSWFWLHHHFDDVRMVGYFNQATALTGYPLHAEWRKIHHAAKRYEARGNRKWYSKASWYQDILSDYEKDTEHFAQIETLARSTSWLMLYLVNDDLQMGYGTGAPTETETPTELMPTSFNDTVRYMRDSKNVIAKLEPERADEAEALLVTFCETIMERGMARFGSVKTCVEGSSGNHHNN